MGDPLMTAAVVFRQKSGFVQTVLPLVISCNMIGYAEIFVGLLLALTVLAMLARKIHVPYPILFVIGGLLLGWVPGTSLP